MQISRLIFIIFSLLISTSVSAEIYKCKTTTGNIRYQETPCDNSQSSSMLSTDSKPAVQQKADTINSASSFQAPQFVGTWCFYKQEGFGETVKESVTIKLNEDKTYVWDDSGIYNAFKLTWHQKGTWRVEDDTFYMTDVGSHRIVEIKKHLIILERISTMFFRKGHC